MQKLKAADFKNLIDIVNNTDMKGASSEYITYLKQCLVSAGQEAFKQEQEKQQDNVTELKAPA